MEMVNANTNTYNISYQDKMENPQSYKSVWDFSNNCAFSNRVLASNLNHESCLQIGEDIPELEVVYTHVDVLYCSVLHCTVLYTHVADDGQLGEHLQDLEPDADILRPLRHRTPGLAHELLGVQPAVDKHFCMLDSI